MTRRRRASGEFPLPVAAPDAIGFFTPEGERSWAPGWNPFYPAGEPSESPGTVFVTTHGTVDTLWVVEHIDRQTFTAAYARVTPGHHAGTVRVRCEDAPGGCVVKVAYDMTALSDDAHVLDDYGGDMFGQMMRDWSALVGEALAERRAAD